MNLRGALVVLAVLLILPAVLIVEVVLASRVARIEGFPSPKLDGTVGTGPPLRLTWIGDSTGTGVGSSSPRESLPHQVAHALDRTVTLRVLAVSGARVQDALDEQLPHLAATRPEWVVVGIGNNDVTHFTRRSTFRARLDRLLTGVAQVEPERIIVLGTAEFSGTPLLKQPLRMLAGARSRVLDGIVREVAAEHGATYVPIREETGAAFKREPDRYHAADGFHPNDAGYGLWADAIVETVRGS